MRQSRLITVVAGTVKPGKCRDCGRRFLWATTAPKGKLLPFDARPLSSSTQRNDQTGVVFELWPAELLHATSCSVRQAVKPERPTSGNLFDPAETR